MNHAPRPPQPRRTIARPLAALAFVLLAGTRIFSAEAVATPATTAEGFAVPQPGNVFRFPRDHGSHPEFKIEWWYITGHLFAPAASGGAPRRFGYQATFFRQAGPRAEATGGEAFGTAHVFLAHMALVDATTGRFVHQERLNRDGWDASAATDTLAVRNGTWSLRLADPADSSRRPTLLLHGGVNAEASFALTLRPVKPLVIFGENGVSRKGADPTAASYYLTFSRLATEGELVLRHAQGTETLRVTGESWMDHEISSSQLSGGQVGWDWLSVQLTDGRELMLYRLRRRDGTSDPASSLTWVDREGTPRRAPFELATIDTWKSPVTGATYPSRIRVSTTDPATQAPVTLQIEPIHRDQELPGSVGGVPYWEGACRVRDAAGREIGSAYLELTGYAKELKL